MVACLLPLEVYHRKVQTEEPEESHLNEERSHPTYLLIYNLRIHNLTCIFTYTRPLYLRPNDDHQAVAKHADSHHKVSHGQPVPQPPNGPLVVVVAIEESRIFDVAL